MRVNQLAIHGGKPVRDSYLPYGRQAIDGEDIRAVVDVLRGDLITTGPVIERFEAQIAERTGAKFAVAFSSGTAALHGACYAAGISDGDEVITSPLTFVASANCVLYQGGIPVFADIRSDTYNLSPKEVEAKITEKTKAIIPVHFAGQPAELDELKALAEAHQLILIEDGAHALGAAYKNKKIGSIGEMTMFSFHPVKPITTGEGGVITTNHRDYYEKLLQFRSHGITRDPNKLPADPGPWYYEMQHLGYNYRLTDIQAALGLSQLRKLESYNDRRKQIAMSYHKALGAMPELILPKLADEVESSWHIYVIRLNLQLLTVGRKEIFQALQAENIGVNVHYIPVHTQPFYRQLGYKRNLCPNAERIYEELITLPLHPGMNEKDVNDVITAVKKVIEYYATKSADGGKS